jgi:hypothetical protein
MDCFSTATVIARTGLNVNIVRTLPVMLRNNDGELRKTGW